MRYVFLVTLALAVAAVSLTAPEAPAREAAEQPLTFSYRDANGTGVLTVLDVGEAREFGGRQIKVRLTQNGARYEGSGITLQLEQQMPFKTLIAFSLASRRGAGRFYQGTTISGITVSGEGTFHPTGSPERKTEWSIVLGGPAPSASGIRGIAVAGPVFPVERPGEPNNRPLPFAILTVQPRGGGNEIARQRADEAGRFEIALAPGTYRLVPLPPDPEAQLPRGRPQTVVVRPGRFTEVTAEYDTGIR
jgi:hypothetical protein